MKLALVYDRLNKVGGAEQILTTLHEIWPEAPWYTSVHNSKRAPFTKNWEVHTSFLQGIPFAKDRHEFLPVFMPFAFEHFDFSEFDVVISISSSDAKGIITKPETLHINYCLTPTRYLWSHKDEYFKSSQYGVLKKLMPRLTSYLQAQLKKWDSVAATRPDTMFSISEHVKSRVKKYYNRDTSVIYPPVDVDKFMKKSDFIPTEKDYYLTVSRLVPYKKVDLLVNAFNKSKKTLVVIGTGAQEKYLKKIAGPNVHIKGYMPDNELIGYYQNAKAFLQANEEDFGISMVEAQAAGIPVIAFGKGGAREILINGKTGLLFDSQQLFEIISVLEKSESINFDSELIKQNARKFAKTEFVKNFRQGVEQEWKKHKKMI